MHTINIFVVIFVNKHLILLNRLWLNQWRWMLDINSKLNAKVSSLQPDFFSYYTPTAKTISILSKRPKFTSSHTWFARSLDLKYRSARGIQKWMDIFCKRPLFAPKRRVSQRQLLALWFLRVKTRINGLWRSVWSMATARAVYFGSLLNSL